MALPHPLAQLSEGEFLKARDTIVKLYGRDKVLFFRSVYLHEPKKADLAPFLEAEHSGILSDSNPRPPRLALVEFDVQQTAHHEYTRAVVNVETGDLVSQEAVGQSSQPYYTV